MENRNGNNLNNNVNTVNRAGSMVPPHSTEAEMAVLGGMMLDRHAIARVMEIINSETFYDPKHILIFETMSELFQKNVAVDIITLAEELKQAGKLEKAGGTIYLTDINSYTPTSANIENHARIIQEKYLKRQLINTCSKILSEAYSDTSDALDQIDKAESEIFEIAEKRMKKSYTGMKQLARDTYKVINKLTERSEKGLTGIPTGYKELDDLLGGFQNSDLVIVAARPSMGKTALALSIARNVAVEYDLPIAVFSIEMASVQLVMRLLSSEAKINQQKIRQGKINPEENQKIVRGLGKLADSPLIIDDSVSISTMELRAKCRRLKAEKNIQMVMVDYLQLMQAPKAESREREISIISQSLKQIAKELEIPVIALAQLNRSIEGRTEKKPMLSDLRESGSIEQDADVVMFINRPEVYGQMHYNDEKKTPTEGTAEIIIGKQRNGPIGTVRLAFQKDYARFENLAAYEPPPEQKNKDVDFDVPVEEEDEGDAPF